LSTLEQQVSHYISALRGADHENACRRLIELGPEVIPMVTTYFEREHDASVRATLVNIASQTNSSDAIPLLTEALNDVEPGVWKEALDGLVSLGGPDALEVIRQTRRRTPEKAEWLDEAIRQIVERR
jgi:HEAT repeat protein